MARLKYDPRGAVIDLTVLCNQACSFCWRADAREVKAATAAAPFKVMPRAMFENVVLALASVESIDALGLSGPMGDPLLVPDLTERALFAKATGKFSRRLILNTNGVAWRRHDLSALLEGFTEIAISLDAVAPALHAEIHGKSGQLDGILAGIDALMAAKRARGGGAVVSVRFTEHDKNRAHWRDFERVMGPRVDRIVRKKIHSFMDVLPAYASDAAVLCDQPYWIVNVGYQGALTTCCVNWRRAPSFGDATSPEALRAAWEGEAYEAWRARRHEDICKGCSGIGVAAQRLAGIGARESQRLDGIKRMGERAYYAGAQ